MERRKTFVLNFDNCINLICALFHDCILKAVILFVWLTFFLFFYSYFIAFFVQSTSLHLLLYLGLSFILNSKRLSSKDSFLLRLAACTCLISVLWLLDMAFRFTPFHSSFQPHIILRLFLRISLRQLYLFGRLLQAL